MAAIEGTRPLLVEIQALVSPSNFGMARQRAMGFDLNRAVLLIAVLEKNLGLKLSNYDVFLNVVGGVRVNEPAGDLAASIAIISSFKDKPVRQDTVIIGEVGLTSEVRSIFQIQSRVNEAYRLRFKRCILPKQDIKNLKGDSKIELIGVDNLQEAVEYSLA
jgi:DNA repair protein RadA/Sms